MSLISHYILRFLAVLVCRRYGTTIRNTCFALFKEVLTKWKLIPYVKIRETDFNIKFPNGSEIIFMGLDEETKLLSLTNIGTIFIEEVEDAMKGMLEPVYKEETIGQVEVRQIYKASKVGTIAGGMVTSGKITRDAKVRLVRDGVVIYEGELGSLKRFKDDVKEVKQGYECGLTIENYNDIKEMDVIEAYKMKEVPVK